MRPRIHRIEPGSLQLRFSSEKEISLEEVRFLYDPELGELRSLRGRSPVQAVTTSSFQWSPAVKALCVLLLRVVEHGLRRGAARPLPGLSGEGGSLASSLDYALSKNPSWLADMFGHDRAGEPYARALILRTNPERKRPGPVELHLDERVLDLARVTVMLDDLPVHDADEVKELWSMIEESRLFAMAGRAFGHAVPLPLRAITTQRALVNHPDVLDDGTPQNCFFHYITSRDEIELDYLQCVQRRVLNRKFSFLGPSASERWQAICNGSNPNYLRSLSLVEAHAADISEACSDSTNIIVVRPGSGVKEAIVAKAFNTRRKVAVFLVEISHSILRTALDTLREVPARKEVFVADYLDAGALATIRRHVSQVVPGPSTFLFLGNIVGSSMQSESFHRLRDAMKPGDTWALDVNLSANSGDLQTRLDSWIQSYDTPEFRAHTMGSLDMLGIDSTHGVMEAEYEQDRFLPFLQRVELFFRFSENLHRRLLGHDLLFCRGERILLSFFYQYTVPTFRDLLEANGFDIKYSQTDESHIYQVVCTKREL
jgi:uncharacterized SAM-dependent methyltransferase